MNTIKPDSIFIRKEDKNDYNNADVVRVVKEDHGQVWFNRFVKKTNNSIKTHHGIYREYIYNFLKKYKKIKISKICKVTSFPTNNYFIIQSKDKFTYSDKQSPEIEIEIVGCNKKRNIVYYKEMRNKTNMIMSMCGDDLIRLINIKSIDEWEGTALCS